MNKLYKSKNIGFYFPLLLGLMMVFGVKTGVGQTELMVNGGFESWTDTNTPSGWAHIESISQETNTVRTGTYSAKHIGGTSDLGQYINVTGGLSYTITVWYKVESGDGTDARIWSYWRSSGSNLTDHASELRGPNNSYFDNNGGVWTEYTVTLDAPLTADEFYFEVRTYSGATVYWDDLSFLENPPPAEPSLISDISTISGLDYYEAEGPSVPQKFVITGFSLDGSDVIVSAPTDFEISQNETGTYGSSITLSSYDGASTDIFVRLKSGLSTGSYSGNVSVSGGGADAITVSVSGEVFEPIPDGYFVTFEGTGETQTGYASATVTLSGLDWDMTEALIGTLTDDWKNGARSARLRGYAASSMTMLENKTDGAGSVSFKYRRYGTDAQVDWKVEYSLDDGASWTQIGSDFTAPASDDVQTFSEEINVAGNVRIRIKRATETGSSNNRLNIDDILITDYEAPPAPAVSTFTVLANNLWSNEANWSHGLPGATTDVIIDGNVDVDITVAVNDLTILDGRTLLDNGNLTINGTFTMQRVIDDGGFAWHFLSAPVSGMPIVGSDFVPNPPWDSPRNFDFYAFDETAAGSPALPWINVRADGSDANTAFGNFVPGKGYLVAYDVGYPKQTFEFTGTMNTGDVTIGITDTESSGNKGWNLIGNPFPSGYLWYEQEGNENLSSNFLYIYDSQGVGNYAYFDYTLNPGKVLPPNQGFFVRADGSSTLTFSDANRVHGGSFLKSNDPEASLVLEFGTEALRDPVVIRIVEDASPASERRDAWKLFSLAAEMPQIFTLASDGERLAVNSMPEVSRETVIPAGLRVPDDGHYSITLKEARGQFAAMDVFLYDRENETEVKLSDQQSYAFHARGNMQSLGDPRFEIRFRSLGDVTAIQSPQAAMARIYAFENTLVVAFGKGAGGRLIELYDLSGRRLLQEQVGDQTEYRRALNLMPGVYIVRVFDHSGTQTERIFIQ